MIDNAFRRVLPRFVGPLLTLYRRLGWTPNQISSIAFFVALAASTAVALGHPLTALGLWWLSRLFDGTDGLHARATGQVSAFGGYLDIVLDMAAYGAMVIGFAIAFPGLQAHWLAMLFLYVLCIASALALGMQELQLALPPRDDRGLRLGAGLAEGGETGIAYSVFLVFPEWLPQAATLWIVILGITVVARTILARRTLRPSPERADWNAPSPAPSAPPSAASGESGSRSTRSRDSDLGM